MSIQIECPGCKRTDTTLIKSRGICVNCDRRLNQVKCKELDCKNKAKCQGFCSKHYYNSLENGTIQKANFQTNCSIPGCKRKHKAKMLCAFHYQRQERGTESRIESELKAERIVTEKWNKVKEKRELKKKEFREEFLKISVGKINENIKFYRFDAYLLSELAEIQVGHLEKLLGHLKEDEQILEYKFHKKFKVVEVHVPNDVELNFSVNLKQKPENVLF